MYFYKIDNGEFQETKLDAKEYAVLLSKDEVKTLREIIRRAYSTETQELILTASNAYMCDPKIENQSYVRIIKALVDHRFVTKTKLKDALYYIHVLPTAEGYFNFVKTFRYPLLRQNRETPNLEYKVKFTKAEVEELKRNERFKSINFDNCLEEVEEDEE